MRSSNPYYYIYNDMLYNGTKLVMCPPSVDKMELLNNISVIGNQAFARFRMADCTFLPQTVTEISSYAFVNCVNLKRVILPNSLLYSLRL